MKLHLPSVILAFWTVVELTNATLPGFFLLPFMPSPKILHKASTTPLPTTTFLFPQATTRIPVHSENVSFQNDYVKLHKWLEHTKQSAHSSKNKNENGAGQQSFHAGEETQPQFHQLPGAVVTVSPSKHHISLNRQVAALATNQGPPQKSLVFHQQQQQQHHHPVPLTFPPTSPGQVDSYSLPKIISLPPLPPPQQQQQQQLPQSSSHYTTSSLSYSFSQGYRQGYGPPKTTKVVRHVSVFVAPPELPYNSQRQKIRVQGDAEKHVNIIFIKGPDSSKSNAAEIELPPIPEQKTYVYVLNKAGDGTANVVVNTPEPPKYNPPDVFFVKYKDGQNHEQEGQQEQYGQPKPQQQYGSPPPQPPPQQQYGSPQPQQEYGPPPTQTSKQHGMAPPQDQKIQHQQQSQQEQQQIHQQKQPPPAIEFVAPSNQEFNYTLPWSELLSLYSGINSDNNTYNIRKINESLSPKVVGESNSAILAVTANRRMGNEDETHYHTHNLNYNTSQTHYNWHIEQDHDFQEEKQENQMQQINETGNDPYSQQNRNIVNNRSISSNDTERKATSSTQTHEIIQQMIFPTSTTTVVTTSKMGDVPLFPAITARSFFPSSTSTVKYNGDGNTDDAVKRALSSKNISSGESANSSGGSSKKSNIAGNVSSNGSTDILVLTKRNFTTAITSGDLVDDNVKKKDHGSPRNISGRPDDFRPYKYAPTMGYDHFGITGHQVVYK